MCTHRSVAKSTRLDIITVHSRRSTIVIETLRLLIFPMKVDVLNIECVDVSWKDTKNREAYVDEQIRAAACHAEDADGWNCESR